MVNLWRGCYLMEAGLSASVEPSAVKRRPRAVMGMQRSAYAALRGVHKSMVTKWVAKGQLIPPAVLEDGSIDKAEADRQLEAILDPGLRKQFRAPDAIHVDRGQVAARPDDAPTAEGTFAAAKQRKAEADAAMAEMELLRRRGELVPVKACHAAMGQIGTMLGQLLDARRMQLAADLLTIRSTNEIAARLERADRDLRRQLAEIASRETERAAVAA